MSGANRFNKTPSLESLSGKQTPRNAKSNGKETMDSNTGMFTIMERGNFIMYKILPIYAVEQGTKCVVGVLFVMAVGRYIGVQLKPTFA